MTVSMNYWVQLEQLSCPFFDQNNFVCCASFSGNPVPAQRQMQHCLTDDHDQCTSYLSKILRQSAVKSSVSHMREFMQK